MSEIENLNRRIRDLERELKYMTMQRDALQTRLDNMAVVADSGTQLLKFKNEFDAVRNDAIERAINDE